MVRLSTHICVTRPQWVKNLFLWVVLICDKLSASAWWLQMSWPQTGARPSTADYWILGTKHLCHARLPYWVKANGCEKFYPSMCFKLFPVSQNMVASSKHFSRYWLLVWWNHRSSVNSPHKGQRRGALMFSLISAWINGWVNNHKAGDLRHHCTHYDVTVLDYACCFVICSFNPSMDK